MAYQVRHREWGLFQGQFLGLGFWHPKSDQPEQGIFKFKTIEGAEFAIAEFSRNSNFLDYSIEEFDEELDNNLTKLNRENICNKS